MAIYLGDTRIYGLGVIAGTNDDASTLDAAVAGTGSADTLAGVTTLGNLTINVLTKAQYDAAAIDPNAMYLVTDYEELFATVDDLATKADIVTVNELSSTVDTKAAKSIGYTVTLTADAWSSNVQTVTVQGITASSNGYVGLAANLTDDQYDAAVSAQLRVTEQADNSVTVKAHGDVPTIDIPIEILEVF